MSFDYFVVFSKILSEHLMDSGELEKVIPLMRGVPGLRQGLILTPLAEAVAHPFPNDETPPPLILQLKFDSIEALEASTSAGGTLLEFTRPLKFPLLSSAHVKHQAMICRPFPIDTPVQDLWSERCSYLVHYPGAPEDLNAWLRHYLAHHPQIMRKFSDIREIEIFTRLDWVDSLPWERMHYFQRNKLVFDTPAALSRSLMSQVIKDMRADYREFPPFTGANVHYVLRTERVML